MVRHNDKNSGTSPIEKKIRDILRDNKLDENTRLIQATNLINLLPTHEMREEMRKKFPDLPNRCKKAIKKIDDHEIM